MKPEAYFMCVLNVTPILMAKVVGNGIDPDIYTACSYSDAINLIDVVKLKEVEDLRTLIFKL
jgi:hypothetical protein